MPKQSNPGRAVNFRAKTHVHLAELKRRGRECGGMSKYINDRIFSKAEDLELSIAALKKTARDA